MKTKLLSLCMLVLCFYGNSQQHPCSGVKTHRSFQKSGNLDPQQIALTRQYDVSYYKLDLNMNNQNTNVSGTVLMQATALAPIDTILYELFNSYTVSGIRLNGIPVTNYTHSGNVIMIIAPVTTGNVFSVETEYAGTAPTAATNPLGGSGLTNDRSPSWGNRVTWSLSEPFSAHEWFPCKQELRDKADSVDIWVTVPSSCKAGANGLLVNTTDMQDGTTRFEWKHRHAIAYYLISVAIAEYDEYTVYAHPSGAPAPVPVQNFIYNAPGYLNYYKNSIDETVNFIEYFSELYGLYPFHDEKYGHCVAPISGGMEHQTMTTQGFFEKSLTAHELAHQWWGDKVTCASWSDVWVNEGFASYSENMMLERLYPGEEKQNMADRHNNIMSRPEGSVWVLDSLNDASIFSSRLTYNKGAAIIHTLRFMVNDDVKFFTALKNFQLQFKDSVATAMDIKASMEAETGIDFNPFFQEWYYGEGFPAYSVRWNTNPGHTQLLLDLTQTVSMPSVTPFFTNDLELSIERTGLPDTVIRLQVSAGNQYYDLPLEQVRSVKSIDPNNWIINKTGTISKDENLASSTAIIPDSEPFTISPNPAKGPFTIKATKEGKYSFQIFDPRGRLIQNADFTQEITVELKEHSAGTYIIQLKNESGSIRRYQIISL